MTHVKGKSMEAVRCGDEAATAGLAARLASTARAGDVFLLEGPLGAGKSVFARGFIQALCGPDTEVPSPTFTLVQTYDSPAGPLYHFDLYRLEDPEEIFELGWDDALAEGICLIEWPSKAGAFLPDSGKRLGFTPLDDTNREITIHDL